MPAVKWSVIDPLSERVNDRFSQLLPAVNFARIVPDGLLVFFPSYHLLTSSLEFWQTPSDGAPTTIWERITRYKQPVVEPRESALFNQVNYRDPTSSEF